jgi:hypothetical protein
VKQRSDDALVDEVISGLELAFRRPLRHAGRCAGATGRAVDGLVAIEDGVAGMGFRSGRCAGPQDVAQAADVGFFRMDKLVLAVEALPQAGLMRTRSAAEKSAMSAKLSCGIDDGVEIAAIGDVHRDLAQSFAPVS